VNFFRTRSTALLGVDIGSSAVKLLQLSRAGGGYRVEHYAVEPLPPDCVVEKNIVAVEPVGEALQRALSRSGAKTKFAASAVAGAAAITQVVTMPAGLSEDALEEQIQAGANRYIPWPIEEMSFDFEVLGPANDDPGSVQVRVAAARTENVDLRVAALELAGLTAKVVDIEAFALENACAPIVDGLGAPAAAIVAVVDIGETMTTLIVLKNRRAIYSREQVFGGRQLSEEIMRRHGLSREEAASAQRRGGLPESHAAQVLEPFQEAVVRQISRLLQFFHAGSDCQHVDRIVLAGGCASAPGLETKIRQQFGVPCVVADPLAGMSLSPRLRSQAVALRQDAPALMVAAGLAMRGFDG
jgi:type IV pilus assembly protein PilM